MSFSFKLNEAFDLNPNILKGFLESMINDFKKEFQVEVEIEKKFKYAEY